MCNLRKFLLCLGLAACVLPRLGAAAFEVLPKTFDFGWAPDNAILYCEFGIQNTSREMIPLTAIQPSCGCTVTDFTPEGIMAAETKKIPVTFNSRGFTGMAFNKPIRIRAGFPSEEVDVFVKGHVGDSAATVYPEGDGIIPFEDGTSDRRKLTIVNNSSSTVALNVIQIPAGWVRLKFPKAAIPAGQKADIEVRASGPFSQDRQTSMTVEATGEGVNQRFTVAFLTGQGPEPVRRLRSAPRSSFRSDPTPTPIPTSTPSPQPVDQP